MLRLNEDARSVLDVLKEGIAIIDTEGRLVFGNRAYCEFLNKEAGGDIGPTDAPILLSAESGTGKELYVHAIHNASNSFDCFRIAKKTPRKLNLRGAAS